MVQTRVPRQPPGPLNQSRAAGAPALPSVAATAPMAGAHGSFYSPDTAESGLSAASDDLGPVGTVTPQVHFTDATREGSMPLERGGSVDREVAEHLAADHHGDNVVSLQAEIERIRGIRKPLGAFSQKLALPEREGYHRHWFNDSAGRIEEAEANGWAHIKGKDGKPLCRCVGSGRDKGALYAYAMEIPLIFWLEDMAARNAAAAAKMDALAKSPFRAPPGAAQKSDSGKFYSPTESEPLQVTNH